MSRLSVGLQEKIASWQNFVYTYRNSRQILWKMPEEKESFLWERTS